MQTPILDPTEGYALWAASYPAHAHNPVMQAEERAMLGLLPTDLADRTLLDVGCGSGRYLRHALRLGAARAIGIEPSPPMLARARAELADALTDARVQLACGGLPALPIADAVADIVVCALVVGHLDRLEPALGELRRVTRSGGVIVCSDFHPIGHALGWLRDFKADGRRYAVRHTAHLYSRWHDACARLGLTIERVVEPMLDPADIEAGAHFDAAALTVPVVLALRLRRED